MKINTDNKTPYTGRCSQIKDAQWVCHVVRAGFPHYSTTRFRNPIYEYRMKNLELYRTILDSSLKRMFGSMTPKQQKLAGIFEWQRAAIAKCKKAREFWNYGCKTTGSAVNNILKQFKYDKLGNCGEDAYVSAAILKLNGINNVYVTGLKIDGEAIDHAVCVFNKDDSPLKVITYDKKGSPDKWLVENNNTIIIDSWVDTADFASNMFIKYKNIYKKLFFNPNANSKFEFRNVRKINLTDDEQLMLLSQYKNLRYLASKREFMH